MDKSFTSTHQNQPLRVVLASNMADRMTAFGAGLSLYADVEMFQAESAERVLQLLGGHTIDLIVIDRVVSDMAGLEVAKMVARLYPFVASVLVSERSEDEFHEETEGLGVLMRLSDPPVKDSALQVLQQMEKIHSVTGC